MKENDLRERDRQVAMYEEEGMVTDEMYISTPKKRDYEELSSSEEAYEYDRGDPYAKAQCDARKVPADDEYLLSEAYKPTEFGDFATYMRNKRMKLKVQEKSIANDEMVATSSGADEQAYPQLFTGTNIYINGHTVPPYAELRRLIHLHGGELMPYLDQKKPVTHIVASNLTAKKRIEFKDYKVVLPSWIMESINQAKRLDWRDFRCTGDASGALKRGTLQRRGGIAENPHPDLTNTAGSHVAAAQTDWRQATASPTKNFTYVDLQKAADVGPWGAASLQKSLGGWARKEDPSVKRVSTEPHISGIKSALIPPSDFEKNETIRAHANPGVQENDMLQKIQMNDNANNKIETGSTREQIIQSPSKQHKKVAFSTDPSTEAVALAADVHHPSHPYASRPSNQKAAQLMSSPTWRKRNTAASGDFLEGYFEKSRLHHLSTWKSEMREMVSKALKEANREQGSVDLPKGMKRVIMHIDFDAFFVSVGMRERPDLLQQPVVVCHAESSEASGNFNSTSEVASCNYVARSHGIRNGMSLGQARRLCANVCTIPYKFEAYSDVATRFYAFLLAHADAIEAVSIDEALIDVSFLLDEMRKGEEEGEHFSSTLMRSYKGYLNSQGNEWTEEAQLAEALRDEIRTITGCEASIGIGSNILLARLATRKAKPGGSFHLQDDFVSKFIDDLDIDDLHGVGWSIRKKCRDVFGTFNIGQLKRLATQSQFVQHFGDKHGVTLWGKLHGKERDKIEAVKQRQSCGAAVNYAIRFKTQSEVSEFVEKLCDEVAARLKSIGMLGKICSVSIMVRSQNAPIEAPKFLGHGICDTFNRSTPLKRSTDDPGSIFSSAWSLINALRVAPDQLRGIGVSLQKLIPKNGGQIPPEREAGQQVLHFSKADTKESNIKDFSTTGPKTKVGQIEDFNSHDTAIAGDSTDMDEDFAMRKSHTISPRSPLSDPLDRSPSSPYSALDFDERSKIDKDVSEKVPSSTHYVIPSASQLDQKVVAALPASIQAQIKRHLHTEPSKTETADQQSLKSSCNDQNETLTSKEDVTLADAIRVSFQDKSLPVTPRRSEKRATVDSFALMRSASQTPTKYTTPTKHKRSDKVSASVPSTPSGSQCRARQMEWEPTWSQIDQNVLKELPIEVREEILRQKGSSDALSHFKSSEIPSPLVKKSRNHMVLRSHSESPRKKQSLLSMTMRSQTPSQNSTPEKHASSIHFKNASPKVDTRSVNQRELEAMNIDPEVFAALPLNVQQEILSHQKEDTDNRKARFKSGHHTLDMTIAQQRLHNRQIAMMDSESRAGHVTLRALPMSSTGIHLPKIKGLDTLEQVRGLISAWFHQFADAGPRQRDVSRISRFMLDSLPRDDVSNTGGSADHSGKNRRPCEIDKVQGILRWWIHLLSSNDWSNSQARHSWYDAFHQVKAQVDRVMYNVYGGLMSLESTEK